jgi:hypothetical protein
MKWLGTEKRSGRADHGRQHSYDTTHPDMVSNEPSPRRATAK